MHKLRGLCGATTIELSVEKTKFRCQERHVPTILIMISLMGFCLHCHLLHTAWRRWKSQTQRGLMIKQAECDIDFLLIRIVFSRESHCDVACRYCSRPNLIYFVSLTEERLDTSEDPHPPSPPQPPFRHPNGRLCRRRSNLVSQFLLERGKINGSMTAP
jgi:hypothetical protein